MNITSRLILFVLLIALLPTSVIAFLAYYNGRNAIEQNLATHLAATALYKQDEFNRWIKSNENKLENIANRPLVWENAAILVDTTSSDPEFQTAYQNLLRDHFLPNLKDGNFLSYSIIRVSDGQIIFSTQEGMVGKFRESEPYFVEGLTHTFTDEVRYSPPDNKVLLHISTPILDREGRLLAVLVGHANLDILTEIMAQGKELTPGEETYLVNPAYFFVTEPWLGAGGVLKNTARTEGTTECLAHQAGVHSYFDYRDVPVIGAYRWIPERNVCILTEIDQQVAQEPIIALREQIVLFTLIFAVVFAGLGLLLARTITTPLLLLRESAMRFGRGELDVRMPETARDEFGMLAREFNHMADSLAESNSQLRERLERYYNYSSNLIVVANFDGYFVEINPAWSKWLGYTTDELLSRPYIELIHPDDRESTRARDNGLTRGIADLGSKNRYRHKDGSWRWLRWESTSDPATKLIYGSAQDITAQMEAEEALRSSEAELRALFSAMPDVILVLNAEGRYLKIAPTDPDLLYKPGEDLLGKTMSEVIPLDLNEKFMEWIHTALRTGETVRGDYSMPINGRALHFSASVSPMTEDTVVWVSRDVTERKQAEDQIKETSAKLEERTKLLDLTATFAFNMRKEIILWSSGMEKLYGWTREEALGSIAHELLQTKYPKPFEEIKAILLHDGHWEGELVHKTKDGTQITVVGSWELQRDENSDPKAVLEAVTDISERKQAENDLRIANERFDLATRAASMGVWEYNVPDNKLVWDDQMFRLYNVQKDQFLGAYEAWEQGVHPDDRARGNEEIQKALSGEKEFDTAFRVQWPDGTVRHIRGFGYVTRDANSEPLRMTGVNYDITEQKNAEEKIKETMESLARSNTELEQFAYVASHDLQEPLRMVTSYMQLLSKRYKGKLDSDADEFIGFAVDGAIRMKRLINDLLTFSRVGTRGQEYKPVPVDVVVKQALENLKIAIQESKAQVTVDPMPIVLADEAQVMQLIQNLLSNGIKFHGEEPPKVHLSAKQVQDPVGEMVWEFCVKDNGIGIEAQYFERVFVIFQRLHNKETYSGTGIGLAICKKIVERHGGRIWVESGTGIGSTFHFTLRAAK